MKIMQISDMENEMINPEMERQLKEQENCLQKSLTVDINVPNTYCQRSWDHVMCWPPAPPGSQVVQSCFEEFNGVLYDSSQNATRWCDELGRWNKTNYEECRELETTDNGSAVIYYTGYSISLIALSIAVFIFLYYRELRCLRNTIHTNLMCTYILVGFMWILTLTLQVSMKDDKLKKAYMKNIKAQHVNVVNNWIYFMDGLVDKNQNKILPRIEMRAFKLGFCIVRNLHTYRYFLHMSYFFEIILFIGYLFFIEKVMFQGHVSMCIVLIILLNYATLTNFFWMFVEGLYLYMLVVRTFSTENIKIKMYLLIGWGIPVPIVIVWSIAKAFETLDVEVSNKAMAEHCPWMLLGPADWVFKFPALCVLSLNSLFLIRIMWVLITKLRSTNSAETQQYRKATKALLVLIPLLGITYMLTIALPTQGIVAVTLQYLRDILLSTQGFMVAIFYCFLNTEVQNAIRHRAEVWKENREIHSERRRFTNSKESPFVGSESVRLFGNHDGSSRAHYLKRESGASDMTTVTYVGCSNSSSGRCRSLSGSVGATTTAVKSNAFNVPITNCV